jgi:digeranylgeranylglycerophospholipid reductase
VQSVILYTFNFRLNPEAFLNPHYETIIIGAGPAGLTAAYFLAKAGRRACVLEQKKEIGNPVCCGEAISAKNLENSGLFDGSYLDSKVKGFRIFSPNNKFFFVLSPGYIINRDKFERYLAAMAQANGAKILLSTKAEGVVSEPGRNWIKTASGDFCPDFIIGADGPGSFVEHELFSNSFNSLDAMQYKISKDRFPYSCSGWLDFYYDTLSPYYFWVFEKQNEFNVGGLVNDKKILLKFINKRFPQANPENSFFSRGKIPMHWIKKTVQKQRVFLIGDAAGLTNPVTFAGIYSAIASGKTAAESIINYSCCLKQEALDAYPKKLKQVVHSDKSIRNIAKYCYKFSQEILDFIGDYFDGRDYRTKDYLKFIKLALKTPSVFGSIFPLIAHRQLLRNHGDDIW